MRFTEDHGLVRAEIDFTGPEGGQDPATGQILPAHPSLMHALKVAALRCAAAELLDASHRVENTEASFWQNQKGCVGEMVCCSYFGVLWDPTVGEIDKHDGPAEVRTVINRSDALILRPAKGNKKADDPARPYVLAWWNHERPTHALLVGWCLGREAISYEPGPPIKYGPDAGNPSQVPAGKFWRKDKQAWFVPANVLRPMPDLLARYERQMAAKAQPAEPAPAEPEPF